MLNLKCVDYVKNVTSNYAYAKKGMERHSKWACLGFLKIKLKIKIMSLFNFHNEIIVQGFILYQTII